MIGFVVRRCAVELGHAPSAAEFAAWANNHGADGESYHLFGRAIDKREAALILKHQARVVTARSATPEEMYVERDPLEMLEPSPQPGSADEPVRGNVVDLAAVRERRRQKQIKRRQRG